MILPKGRLQVNEVLKIRSIVIGVTVIKSTQQFAVILSALLLGFSGAVVAGQSATLQCKSEECACEEALQQNTVEALEDFLRRYPHAINGESACAALAVPSQGGDLDPRGLRGDDDSDGAVHPDLVSPGG